MSEGWPRMKFPRRCASTLDRKIAGRGRLARRLPGAADDETGIPLGALMVISAHTTI